MRQNYVLCLIVFGAVNAICAGDKKSSASKYLAVLSGLCSCCQREKQYTARQPKATRKEVEGKLSVAQPIYHDVTSVERSLPDLHVQNSIDQDTSETNPVAPQASLPVLSAPRISISGRAFQDDSIYGSSIASPLSPVRTWYNEVLQEQYEVYCQRDAKKK